MNARTLTPGRVLALVVALGAVVVTGLAVTGVLGRHVERTVAALPEGTNAERARAAGTPRAVIAAQPERPARPARKRRPTAAAPATVEVPETGASPASTPVLPSRPIVVAPPTPRPSAPVVVRRPAATPVPSASPPPSSAPTADAPATKPVEPSSRPGRSPSP